MKKVVFLSVLLVFGLASMSIAQNANCIGYFALEVPLDVTITVDGDDSDWAWFDPAFCYGSVDLKEILVGVMPEKDDLDIAVMTAWTGTDRDNKLYGFCRVTDDELVLKQTELDAGWFDDEFEIIPDADNSGGPYRAEGVVTDVNAQQFIMHIPTPGGYESPYCGGLWWMRSAIRDISRWCGMAGMERDKT